MGDLLISLFSNLTFILLFVGLFIFGALTVKKINIRSFQFQISIIFVVLIVAEMIDVLFDFEYIPPSVLRDLGSFIHVSAMAGIAIIFWSRFYQTYKDRHHLTDES